MAAGKKRGAQAPRPRSGFVTEEQRHTVRVRVSREHAEALAERWGTTAEDAVRRAVREVVLRLEPPSDNQGENR